MIPISLFLISVIVIPIDGKGEYSGQRIWDLINIPEEDVNLGLWSLIISKEYDPSINVEDYLNKLDALAQAVKNGLPDQSDLAKVSLTQIVLYKPGFWNQEQVFSFNFSDPFGEESDCFLLSKVLETREGNCISLPLLFLTVIERVDPKVNIAGVRAPVHLFCRFHDRQKELHLNIEATSGIMYEGSYEDSLLPPKPEAVESGLYLRDLTKKELLSELIVPLVKKEKNAGNIQAALKYAELILHISPDSVSGFVAKSSTLHQMAYEILQTAKNENRPLTEQENSGILELGERGKSLLEKALAKGWEPFTPEDRTKYLESIQKIDD